MSVVSLTPSPFHTPRDMTGGVGRRGKEDRVEGRKAKGKRDEGERGEREERQLND